MKTHLFYTFLSIFVVTTIVTLLGVTEVILIKDGYLTPLVGAFILELAGAVIAIFKSASFFDDDDRKEPREQNPDPRIERLDAQSSALLQRVRDLQVHFESEILRATHLPPTVETDTMALIHRLESMGRALSPEVLNSSLSTIADLIEERGVVSTLERSALKGLVSGLPQGSAGPADRIEAALDHKRPNKSRLDNPLHRRESETESS